MKESRLKLLVITSLLSLSIFLVSCNSDKEKNIIEESGTMETIDIIVSSQSTGVVLEYLFDEGNYVGKGDTLIIIDHELLNLQLKEVSASLSAAEAQLNLLKRGSRTEDISQAEQILKQSEANFESVQADKERFENLYKSKTITKKQLDDILTRYEISLSQMNAAKENLKKIKNIARPEDIQQAEANFNRFSANRDIILKRISDCFITSPIDGQIIKRFVETGELVTPQTSLLKISDQTKVDLTIYVSETDLGRIKTGQSVEIKIDTFKDKSYLGEVVFISPEAEFTPKNIQTKDERTKLVFAVKVKIPNENRELKSGMPADAFIKVN